ncbi:uncharacterized protein GGS22DRAFT_155916 [Annulohypoxylon maeteangense]|uniref:uncharacterized protein n=1 Tax=Annulohypoxylon maeteangense TaxID=1927788 RepID=UPI00200815E8|nr:uncharacterized protein GGS22DRAFT_155916 [Annulohypoxylon maeteangense]KAI0888458.1 hypothetical protein GGS22DRAFT_155916 [Annulohypoxylon maeteangense]
MTRLHLLLAVTSLSGSVLGGVLYGHNPQFRPCAPGTKICHEDTIYRCSTQGKWVGDVQCIAPNHCFDDRHTKDAVCLDSNVELKRSAPATTPAPSLSEDMNDLPPKKDDLPLTQATTPTPTLTQFGAFPPGVHHTGDLRCNGPCEEMWDDSAGWREVERCSECFEEPGGVVNCIPIEANLPTPTPCKPNEFRCSGKWQEVCLDGFRWEKLQKCFDCSQDADGVVDCVPNTLPSLPPSPVCHEGTLRCTGNWLEMCDNDRQWHAIQRCARCDDDGNGQTLCIPRPSITNAAETAAPTRPAASPTVPRMTAIATVDKAPAPPSPSFELPSLASRSVPDVGVSKDNPCFGGEVKCNGDRVNVCMTSHTWEDFGPVCC